MPSMKNRVHFLRLIALAGASVCASVYCPWVVAQTAVAADFKEVVVTASRSPQLITEAVAHTTVLNATDIARSQATDLTSLLQREAGIQITQNGGRGTSATVFLRGAASLQVLVLVDGVSMAKQDASGSISLENLMTDQIERVEIVRGNVSAIYGSGAIGGVIQVFTKQGGGAPRADVTAEAGSRASSKVSASVQAGFGDDNQTRISAGVSTNRTRGFSALDTRMPSNANANSDSDGYKNNNWSFALSQQLAKGHTAGLRTTHSDGRYDFDSAFDTPTDVHTGRTRTDATTLFTENQLAANWQSKLSLSQSNDLNTNTYPANTAYLTPAYSDSYRSRNRLLNWTNTAAFGSGWLATVGAERQNQAIDTDDGSGGQYARTRGINALFAGLQGRHGAQSLQANVRHDALQNAQSKTTGYLGYGFDLAPQWRATASVSTAFNVAPLGYLYAPYFGNPALKPETARSQELGMQYAAATNRVRASYFRTRSSDQFLYDFATSQFQNVSRSKNSGLELSYSGQVGATELRASLTQQNPIDESTGKTLRRRAKSLGSLSASYPFGALRLGADLRFAGVRQDGVNTLDAYRVVDLQARYLLTPVVNLFGRVENLANTVYQTAYGYNQAPRGIFVGLNWQPKF